MSRRVGFSESGTGPAYPPVPTPSPTRSRRNSMTKLPPGTPPELLERLGTGGGDLPRKMGIEFLELSPEYSVATMPVQGNTQVVGILHGGAHVVLGESLGSISLGASRRCGRMAVGIEINATHSRSVDSGIVTGTCRALVLGKNTLHARDRDHRRRGAPPLHRAHDQHAARPALARLHSATRPRTRQRIASRSVTRAGEPGHILRRSSCCSGRARSRPRRPRSRAG